MSLWAAGLSLFPAILFVINIYVMVPAQYRYLSRNNTRLMLWRMASVMATCFICLFWAWYLLDSRSPTSFPRVLDELGFSVGLNELLLPALLTKVLFLGPIYDEYAVQWDTVELPDFGSFNSVLTYIRDYVIVLKFLGFKSNYSYFRVLEPRSLYTDLV